MSTEHESGPVTLIAVLEAPVENTGEFIEGWRAHLERLRTAPGFRGARLHRALRAEHRFQLVAVADWADAADLAAAAAGEQEGPGAEKYAKTVHRGVYRMIAEAASAERPDGAGVTMINLFELPNERVEEFLGAWRPRAQRASESPGFVDFRMHRAVSDASLPLVNVAHYASVEVWKALQADPEFQARKAVNPPYATANPGLFEVVAEVL
ncbi:antibiotic biosynthesis monooxygenase family protein [Streptomyces sp. 900105755]|uniref:antibiotic biosynthesis monooxygenase family protein n=1 Tax=unclassified Streptomyces TaxID=2593676 RepID=UPI000894D69B|nr:antibiotic biosynthesis monooxygenase [Streptomyces sp. Ag109_O5-10]SEE10629.1 Antibiotic biosynthesis monooxygenase [Streptomyces sp. Ag109_O5-10]